MATANCDNEYMERALQLARQGALHNEVPVGAVVVRDGAIIGAGFNQPISANDPTAHAEIVALRAASKHCGNYRLAGATLYVTLEPCTMCVGALIHARIERLVFAAREPRAGAVVSQQKLAAQHYFNHSIAIVEGVLAEQCGEMLQAFFQAKRNS